MTPGISVWVWAGLLAVGHSRQAHWNTSSALSSPSDCPSLAVTTITSVVGDTVTKTETCFETTTEWKTDWNTVTDWSTCTEKYVPNPSSDNVL